MGPKNLHFWHARWCWCRGSMDHTHSSTGLNHRYPTLGWQFIFELQPDHYWENPAWRTYDKIIICLVFFILPLYILSSLDRVHFVSMFPLIPKYLEMQNHCIEFYCPSFHSDESSFNRHVSLHQMYYVILWALLREELICLWSRWLQHTPSWSNSDLGGFPEVWQKTLWLGLSGKGWPVILLLKPPTSMLMWAGVSLPRLPHSKVGFIFREEIISH